MGIFGVKRASDESFCPSTGFIVGKINRASVENRHEGSISPTPTTALDVWIKGESF